MRSEPIIIVTCDRCRTEEELPLTATSHGYDERNVSSLLQSRGWSTINGDICHDCQEELKQDLSDLPKPTGASH